MRVSSVVAARPGLRQRQHDVPENTKPGGAIKLGRLFQLDGQVGKEIMHQPDHNGQVGNRIDQNECQMCVKQSDSLEHDINWNDHDNGWQYALGNDPEQNVAIAQCALEVLAKGASQKEEQAQGQRPTRPTMVCRHSLLRRSQAQ